MRNLIMATLSAALLLSATAHADPEGTYAVAPDEAVFWSGPSPTAASCGDRCWEYALYVERTAWRLRVGIDHATLGDVWTAEVLDPAGASRTSFSPEAGLYSNEGFVEDPPPGRWTVRVVADSAVTDMRFRMRARLERQPQYAVPHPVLPNLQALPPYDFTFETPATTGNADGQPTGVATPGGRLGCHAEEVVEEGAQRCLRMAYGVRNTGQGPMTLFYEGGLGFADRVLMQRVLSTDGTHTDREAGIAKYHKTHQHYHHDNAIGLNLLKVTDPATGRLEPAAVENLKGFAHRNELLREWTVFYPTWPDDFGFGLRAGWGDYYEWDRPGNYIDFALNTDGRYVLRMTADPVGGVLESNELDNTSYSLIEVAGETVTWLESGRGSDPWDHCKILMPMGAEPGDPASSQPPRPADCPPDTTGLDAPPLAAQPALVPPPAAAPAGGPPCVRRARLRVPHAARLRSARVYVGSRRVRTLRGRALRRPLTVALPRGRVTMRIVGTTRSGRKVVRRRTFQGC